MKDVHFLEVGAGNLDLQGNQRSHFHFYKAQPRLRTNEFIAEARD